MLLIVVDGVENKSGVLEPFNAHKFFLEKQTNGKNKCLQSDNRGEYCNATFQEFLGKEGIEKRLTVAYTPAQQNGVTERMNRTLIDMAGCMLL